MGLKKMITVICNECGRVWTAAVILGENTCPQCGSKNISAAVTADSINNREW
jgi:DNA-directed RNA polymerase subunit RPC12/RpoP